MHIKVKDQSWALAVEGFLKGEFNNFFVNTNEDRLKLTQISKRLMPNWRLTVVASKFVDQVNICFI